MVVGLKEATGKLDNASAVAAACDIAIVSGDDSLTLPIGSVGGCGVISVLSNLLPGEVRKLCDAIAAGDMIAARSLHLRLFPLFKGIFLETNPICIKAALAMAGMIRNELRLPMTPLGEAHRPTLAKLLADAGVKVTP
jgi:4-hydroxy-tetrahydrodipicolinate synthase